MEADDLRIDVRETKEHVWHISGRGELDISGAPKLAGQIERLVDGGATFIVLDLSQVSFLDSSGLRAIVTSGHLLESKDGRLVIEGMSPAVERILEVTDLLESYRR